MMKKLSPSVSSASLASSTLSSATNIIRKSSSLLRRPSSKDPYSNVPDGLRRSYKKILQPLEEESQFHFFGHTVMEDSEFDAKPMIMLVGQYSTGKTTFIKYLLGEDYPGMKIGPEPTTDKFTILMHSQEAGIIPGNAVVVDAKIHFRNLAKFGNAFLNRMQLSHFDASFLKSHTIIDTPGILSGEKQSRYRGYDYTGVLDWFASRVDKILILFDANKLDISDELRRTMRVLKAHDEKISIILNKAGMVEKVPLMRVYGALMWSLGKVLDNPEVVRVYCGSFWDKPPDFRDWEDFLMSEKAQLFADLNNLPRQAALRKLNDFSKRTRAAKIQALIINELMRRMPTLFGKEKKKKELIENLEEVFIHIKDVKGISLSDFPDLEMTREKLKSADWSKFRLISDNELAKIDTLLAEDMSKLMSVLPGGVTPNATTETIKRKSSFLDMTDASSDSQSTSEKKNAASNSFLCKSWDANSVEDWVVSNHPDHQSWMENFQKFADEDGKVSGKVARDVMLLSNLPRSTLKRIWDLSDLDKDGKLNCKEFALASYLMQNNQQEDSIKEEY